VTVALAELGGWRAVLGSLVAGRDLEPPVAAAALAEILGGAAEPAHIAGFVVGLRAKGETVGEVAAMVEVMLANAQPLDLPDGTIDIVGTGGSARRREAALNVSTLASLVAAGAGATVCKHGNKLASSTSGSFDLLEGLGVAIVGFCFARTFHPAMRHAGPTRVALGIPTVFNILGPLSHPGRVRRQVVGVADPSLLDLVAGVLAARGMAHALVVHGHDGLDELSLAGPTTVREIRDGVVTERLVSPGDLGLAEVAPAAMPGGDPAANVTIAKSVLAGEPGPARDIVVLNAGAGLYVGGVAPDLADGVQRAQAAIDSGAAAAVLDRLITTSTA
jgi:anthranilate phosphoribosyltransferase